MEVKEIPVNAVPNQSLSFVSGTDTYYIEIQTRRSALYLSLTINGSKILSNRSLIPSAPIDGGIVLIDTGSDGKMPDYTELGTRYRLLKWTS